MAHAPLGVEKERKLKRKKRRQVYAVYRDGPRPVDVHVGRMVRERRVLMGMSQEELGASVGLTFQQIQKYERGTNRISASMLWELSIILRVPVGWFFEGIKGGGKPKDRLHTKRGTLELVRAFSACSNEARERLLSLINAIADSRAAK